MAPNPPSGSGEAGSASGSSAPQNPNAIEAMIDILKQEDAKRLERNKAREQRRKRGEAVGEDEPDITPMMLPLIRAASSVNPVGASNPGDAAKNPQPKPTSTLAPAPNPSTSVPAAAKIPNESRFADVNAVQQDALRHEKKFSQHLFTPAQNGISPWLSLYTADSVERLQLNREIKTHTVTRPDGVSVHVLDMRGCGFQAENTLDRATWMSCYTRFIAFLSELCGEDGEQLLMSFQDHYETMVADPSFEDWFEAFVSFDALIRAQWFYKPFFINPSAHEWDSQLQQAKNKHTSKQMTSLRATTSKLSTPQYSPYTRYTDHSNDLCLRCGRIGHRAESCEEPMPSCFGRVMQCKWDNGRLVRITDDHVVCARFNLTNGCQLPATAVNADHGVHMCSLCGDRGHGASNCTRNN